MKKVCLILIVCVILSSVLFAETKKTVAVLEFEGGTGQDAITLADLFASELANKNIFTILTRTSVDAIMKEHNFQRLNITDTENIKAIGELVNADYIIVGKITTLGDIDLLTVQMVNVVTGQVEAGEYVSFENISDTLPSIDTMVANITGIETGTIPKSVVGTGNVSGTILAMYEGKEDIELIKALISRGINATDDNGYTPLILASSYGYTELVKELITAGADVNVESYDGGTAFTIAAQKGQKWVIEVLKDAGVEVKTYKIGDTGSGGGLVFYIEGYTYYECSDNLGETNWEDAKQMAEDYRGGGYEDWYLPNKTELNYIYENLAEKGFIEASGWLWSSSEGSSTDAWDQNFYDGRQSNYAKTVSIDVRAIRAFNY